jgi:hypothetical protein
MSNEGEKPSLKHIRAATLFCSSGVIRNVKFPIKVKNSAIIRVKQDCVIFIKKLLR